MTIPTDENLNRAMMLSDAAARLAKAFQETNCRAAESTYERLLTLAGEALASPEKSANDGKTPDEIFEHFLHYSGLYAEADDVKAKLRQAFDAAL